MKRSSNPTAARPASIWIYRACAVIGIPALLFLALEGSLRAVGFGRSAHFLIPDEEPGYVRSNPQFVSLFLPANFDLRPLNFRLLARKPANTVRIVLLGESAAQGIPAPAFGFGPQLRAQLRARYPGKNIEVINTGIVAINSHVVAQIARDLAGYSPDLFVVYLGNNEVVGPYGPGCTYLSQMPPLWVIRLSVFLRSTRTGQLLATLVGKASPHESRSLEWGGMAMFVNQAVTGDDPRLERVYRNFEDNLREIVRVADHAGAKTLLCTVVANLKDCPPLLSVHRPGLAPAELVQWQQVFSKGSLEWKLGETAGAKSDLEAALRLDPQYADTAFMLGSLELQAGNLPVARTHLLEAAHWDALRFRPDPRLNEIIRRVAADSGTGTSLVDAAVLLGSDPASTVRPAGRELLFEHVHFDWEGNFQLARLLAPGVGSALFGAGQQRPAWLDSSACAAALAYTPHERSAVLQRLAQIVRNPPFTNQLTYGRDQARLARDLARAAADRRDPAVLQRAESTVQAAIAGDSDNPELAKIAEDLALDLGETTGALEHAQRVRRLRPADLRTSADEASLLVMAGRAAEAEELLQQAARLKDDPVLLAAVWADFFSRTKRWEEGRRYLDLAIAQNLGRGRLKLMRGELARQAGDRAAAERDCRAVLAADPANQEALEALVSLLNESGRPALAEKESLAAADQQPGNLANNLRAALIAEAHGEGARSVRFLLAAEQSGPVTSAIELRLARKFLQLGQTMDALTHLAEARQISVYEDDPAATDSINQIIASVRSAP